MSSIQTKQFNWLSRPSAWQTVQNWREKHRAFQDQADTSYAVSADNFGAAAANLASGLSQIAARRASARVSALAQAKVASLVDTKA